MTDATASIERRMARSAAWMIGLRLADRGIGLVSVLFLARLLVPADFGIVAMGTVILGVLEAVTAFGFEMALIKSQARDRPRLDTAWTLNVLVGTLNAAITLALAPLAAEFYGEPRVLDVMLALSLAVFLSGFRNIGVVQFEQEMRFAPIVLLALARRTAAFLVTLTLAWLFGSYWALLAGMVVGHLVDVPLSFRVSSYRPRFCLSAWRDLVSFSKWLLLNNVLSYISGRGGDAIVGNRAGAATLGTYTVSFELANLPTSEMVWPVMRAVFPGYALMSGDRKRLAQGFVKVFSLVLMFALPAAAGIGLLAEPIVAVLLGARWPDAVPMIQVLAVYGAVRATQANMGSIYMALDRPQLVSAITFLNIVLSLGAFGIALIWLPVAEAAWYLVGGGVLVLVVNVTTVRRMLALHWNEVLGALVRPALGVAAMSAALLLMREPLWNGGRPVIASALVLVVLIAAGAIVYLSAVLLVWQARGRPVESPEHAVLATLAARRRRRTAT